MRPMMPDDLPMNGLRRKNDTLKTEAGIKIFITRILKIVIKP
jgi:hypothetical protein